MEALNIKDRRNAQLLKKYGISELPSIVIDGKIKVAGKPNFPWFCGGDSYGMLEEKYPLKL